MQVTDFIDEVSNVYSSSLLGPFFTKCLAEVSNLYSIHLLGPFIKCLNAQEII